MDRPTPDKPGGPPRRLWTDKFRDAFAGIRLGVLGQSSFAIHLGCAAVVVVTAAALHVTAVEWCLLVICITAVLAAELFNSSIERLAKAVSADYHAELGAALDIAAAAVLMMSAGAAVVGVVVFLPRVIEALSPIWAATG